MKTALMSALLLGGGTLACGSRDDESSSNEVSTSAEKDNASTWDEQSKNNMYLSCMGTRTDAYMNAYCVCGTQCVVRMFPMNDVELNTATCMEKWKASGEVEKCVAFAGGVK
jgi:hypothetical protein